MKYEIILAPKIIDDIKRFKKSGDRRLLKKLSSLLEELELHPTTGTGKPEQLKHYRVPTYSRRISDKHRLVYQIEENIITVLVLSTWGHYDDK